MRHVLMTKKARLKVYAISRWELTSDYSSLIGCNGVVSASIIVNEILTPRRPIRDLEISHINASPIHRPTNRHQVNASGRRKMLDADSDPDILVSTQGCRIPPQPCIKTASPHLGCC